MDKQTKFNLWFALFAILALGLIQNAWMSYSQTAHIPYSEFQQLLADKKVESIGIPNNFIQGTLKEALPNGKTRFETTRVDPDFAKELSGFNVTFTEDLHLLLLAGLPAHYQKASERRSP